MDQLSFVRKDNITGKKKTIKVANEIRKATPGTFNDSLLVENKLIYFKLSKKRVEVGKLDTSKKEITLTKKHAENWEKIPRYFRDCFKDFFHDYKYIKTYKN